MEILKKDVEIPNDYYTLEIGKAKKVKEGNEISVITYGMGVHWALEALNNYPNISVEVIDPRTLTPLDRDTISKSVLKTKRLVVVDPGWHSFGASSEIITSISEKNIHKMKANPILITLQDIHNTMSVSLEKKYYIKQENIVLAVKKLINHKE